MIFTLFGFSGKSPHHLLLEVLFLTPILWEALSVAQMCCMQHNPKKGKLVSSGYDLDVLYTLCVRSNLSKIGMECFFSNLTPDDGKGEKDASFQTFRTHCFSHQYTNAPKESRHYYRLQSKANLVSLHFGLNPYLSHMHTVPKTWQLFFTFFPCILYIDFLHQICLKCSALWKNGQQWFSLQIFNFCGSRILDWEPYS